MSITNEKAGQTGPTEMADTSSAAYRVTAVAWAGGWELHIDGEGVTQVRTLDHAARQVRDYLETLHDMTFVADPEIIVSVDLGGLEDEVAAARRDVETADRMRSAAAVRLRAVARRLREEKQLSVTDSAAVLGVSRGRVSQLVAGSWEA